VKAIIDTGSGVSLVSPKFCRMLGVDQYREWSGPRLLLMDGKTLVPNGSVKLRIYVEGRLVWIKAAVSEMNGFDLLLGNDALSQLGCFSVQYDEAGVRSFWTTTTTNEDPPRGKAGYIMNHDTISVPAFSMVYVNTVVPQLGGRNPGHLVEPSPKFMADKGVSIGRFLLNFTCSQRNTPFPLDKLLLVSSIYPRGNGRRENPPYRRSRRRYPCR
jgi:hypothetical protein